jgi:hypothetical protein
MKAAAALCSSLQQPAHHLQHTTHDASTAALETPQDAEAGTADCKAVPQLSAVAHLQLSLRLVSAVAVAVPLLLRGHARQQQASHGQQQQQQQLLQQARQLLYAGLQQMQQLTTAAAAADGQPLAGSVEAAAGLQHHLLRLAFVVACREQQEPEAKRHLQTLVEHPHTSTADLQAAAAECLQPAVKWRSESLAALAYGFMLRLAGAADPPDAAAVLAAAVGIMGLDARVSHGVKVRVCSKVAAVLQDVQQQQQQGIGSSGKGGNTTSAAESAAAAVAMCGWDHAVSNKLQWLISTFWNSAVIHASNGTSAAVAQQYLDCAVQLAELQGCPKQQQQQRHGRQHWLLQSKQLAALKALLHKRQCRKAVTAAGVDCKPVADQQAIQNSAAGEAAAADAAHASTDDELHCASDSAQAEAAEAATKAAEASDTEQAAAAEAEAETAEEAGTTDQIAATAGVDAVLIQQLQQPTQEHSSQTAASQPVHISQQQQDDPQRAARSTKHHSSQQQHSQVQRAPILEGDATHGPTAASQRTSTHMQQQSLQQQSTQHQHSTQQQHHAPLGKTPANAASPCAAPVASHQQVEQHCSPHGVADVTNSMHAQPCPGDAAAVSGAPAGQQQSSQPHSSQALQQALAGSMKYDAAAAAGAPAGQQQGSQLHSSQVLQQALAGAIPLDAAAAAGAPASQQQASQPHSSQALQQALAGAVAFDAAAASGAAASQRQKSQQHSSQAMQQALSSPIPTDAAAAAGTIQNSQQVYQQQRQSSQLLQQSQQSSQQHDSQNQNSQQQNFQPQQSSQHPSWQQQQQQQSLQQLNSPQPQQLQQAVSCLDPLHVTAACTPPSTCSSLEAGTTGTSDHMHDVVPSTPDSLQIGAAACGSAQAGTQLHEQHVQQEREMDAPAELQQGSLTQDSQQQQKKNIDETCSKEQQVQEGCQLASQQPSTQLRQQKQAELCTKEQQEQLPVQQQQLQLQQEQDEDEPCSKAHQVQAGTQPTEQQPEEHHTQPQQQAELRSKQQQVQVGSQLASCQLPGPQQQQQQQHQQSQGEDGSDVMQVDASSPHSFADEATELAAAGGHHSQATAVESQLGAQRLDHGSPTAVAAAGTVTNVEPISEASAEVAAGQTAAGGPPAGTTSAEEPDAVLEAPAAAAATIAAPCSQQLDATAPAAVPSAADVASVVCNEACAHEANAGMTAAAAAALMAAAAALMAAAAHAAASQAGADLEGHAVADSSGLTTPAAAKAIAAGAAVAGAVGAIPVAAAGATASQGAEPASSSLATQSGGGSPSHGGNLLSGTPSRPSSAGAPAGGSSAGGGGHGIQCPLLQSTQMFFAASQQLGELLLSDSSQDGL